MPLQDRLVAPSKDTLPGKNATFVHQLQRNMMQQFMVQTEQQMR